MCPEQGIANGIAAQQQHTKKNNDLNKFAVFFHLPLSPPHTVILIIIIIITKIRRQLRLPSRVIIEFYVSSQPKPVNLLPL